MILLCMLPIVVLLAIGWVRGIDYMQENHPDYKGEDLFNEDKEDK